MRHHELDEMNGRPEEAERAELVVQIALPCQESIPAIELASSYIVVTHFGAGGPQSLNLRSLSMWLLASCSCRIRLTTS